jgi:hypothetical protein
MSTGIINPDKKTKQPVGFFSHQELFPESMRRLPGKP